MINNLCLSDFELYSRWVPLLGVEGINSKAQVKEKLGHMVQIHICRLPWTWQLSSAKKEEKRLCSKKNCKESIAMQVLLRICLSLNPQGPKQMAREDQGSTHPSPLPLFYVGKADYFFDNTPTNNEFLSRYNLQFWVSEKKNENLFISKWIGF